MKWLVAGLQSKSEAIICGAETVSTNSCGAWELYGMACVGRGDTKRGLSWILITLYYESPRAALILITCFN